MASSGLSVGTLEDLRDMLEQNVLLTLFWHEVKLGLKSWLYKGWIVLETKCPTGKLEADFRKNAATVRDLFGLKS